MAPMTGGSRKLKEKYVSDFFLVLSPNSVSLMQPQPIQSSAHLKAKFTLTVREDASLNDREECT